MSIPRWTGLQNGKQAKSLLTPCSSLQCSPTSQVVHPCTHAHHWESHHSASRRSNSDSHILLQHSIRLVDVHHQSSIQHNMQQKCRMFSERYMLQFCFILMVFFLYICPVNDPSIYLFIYFYLFIYVFIWSRGCLCQVFVYKLDFMPTKIQQANSRKPLYFISHYHSFLSFDTLIAVLISCCHLT